MTLSSWSSCFYLLSARSIGVNNHAQFTMVLGTKPSPHLHQASTLSRELCFQLLLANIQCCFLFQVVTMLVALTSSKNIISCVCQRFGNRLSLQTYFPLSYCLIHILCILDTVLMGCIHVMEAHFIGLKLTLFLLKSSSLDFAIL